MKKEASSRIVSITVPPRMKEMLDVVGHLGYYDSLSEFIRDAVRTHLQRHRHLHVLIVYHLYKQKKLSLSQASSLLDLSLSELTDLFAHMEV